MGRISLDTKRLRDMRRNKQRKMTTRCKFNSNYHSVLESNSLEIKARSDAIFKIQRELNIRRWRETAGQLNRTMGQARWRWRIHWPHEVEELIEGSIKPSIHDWLLVQTRALGIIKDQLRWKTVWLIRFQFSHMSFISENCQLQRYAKAEMDWEIPMDTQKRIYILSQRSQALQMEISSHSYQWMALIKKCFLVCRKK